MTLFGNNITRMLAITAVATIATVGMGGCQTYHDYDAFVQTPRPIVTGQTYRMAPPDEILIVSRRVREISGHREKIRPDGNITLPLLGTVYVAGRTPEEVSEELQILSKDYYEDADVSLRVVGFNSKKIFVFGEVGLAGPYPYNGANTVLETLARAQPTRFADPQQIQVLRPNENGEMIRRMTIDLNQMVRGGDTTLNAVLEEGDIIYVPANPLAAVGLTLQQILLPITPAASIVQNPASINSDLNQGPYTNQSNGTQ